MTALFTLADAFLVFGHAFNANRLLALLAIEHEIRQRHGCLFTGHSALRVVLRLAKMLCHQVKSFHDRSTLPHNHLKHFALFTFFPPTSGHHNVVSSDVHVLLYLQHFRRQRDDLHIVFLAELARHGAEDTGSDGIELLIDKHHGVIVKPDS